MGSTGVRDSVSPAEWEQRVHLAACLRKIAHLGWDDVVYTHVSARVPDAPQHVLVNSDELAFDEITASNLLKVDFDGNRVLPSEHGLNPRGHYQLHSVAYEARSEVHAVIHLHTVPGIAVSAQKAGLLTISQHSLVASVSLGYHPYESPAITPDERQRLKQELARHDVLILRNHGLQTCGATVAQAFWRMYFLERACEIQTLAQGGGDLETIELPPPGPRTEEILKTAHSDVMRRFWPAILRSMDRLDPGYRE